MNKNLFDDEAYPGLVIIPNFYEMNPLQHPSYTSIDLAIDAAGNYL